MKTKKRLLGILLSLALVLGLMPGMSMTVYAATETVAFTFNEDVPSFLDGRYVFTKSDVVLSSNNFDGNSRSILLQGNQGGSTFTVTAPNDKILKEVQITLTGDNQTWIRRDNSISPISSDGKWVFSNINANSALFWYDGSMFGPSATAVTVIYGDPHTHNFTYSLNDASDTITAACSEDCDITTGLTLTINAPTGELVYDGTKTFPATLSTGYNTEAFPGEYTIRYYYGTNEVEPTNVKAAGDYTAKVTVGTVTAQVDFTIAKATPSIETIPTASAITYGQTLADSTLTEGTAKLGDNTVAGTFVWKSKETKPVVSDSETTEYDVVFTPTDTDNYKVAECKVKLTINKAASIVTAPTAKTLTYTGQAQELVTAGSTEDGTLYYAVTTENVAPSYDNLYTTSIPTATDDGTYYVWYKVVGDANHFDSEAKCIESIIKEQPKEEPKETPKEVDVTPEVEENTEDNSSEEVPTETQSPYRTEWVDGQWYGADGNTDYKGKGTWKSNETGWWYEDSDGWYPSDQWQKIDGKWYYFDAAGYMASNEWVDGYWLSGNGAWEYQYIGSWKTNGTDWWYEDTSGWYPVSQWQKIDGKWYYFGSDGIMATDQYIGEYWVGSDGSWQ